MLYVPPNSDAVEGRFNIPSSGPGGGLTPNAATAIIRAYTGQTSESGKFASDRIPDIVPAVITVYPDNVIDAGSIERFYTTKITQASQALLLDKYPPGPQQLGRIRMTERNTGAVLHEEAWVYSGDDWVFQWSIDATEAAAIGDLGSAEDFEVRLEFGRGSGNSFVRLEVTDYFRILIGRHSEYTATEADVNIASRILRVDVGTANAMETELDGQSENGAQKLIKITADFTLTAHGATNNYRTGEYWHLPARTAVATKVIDADGGSALTLANKIQLLGIDIEPGVLGGKAAADLSRTYAILFSNEELLTGESLWYAINFGGPTTSRQEWNGGDANIVVSQAPSGGELDADTVSSSATLTDNYLRVQIIFYDAAADGNVVETIDRYINIAQPPDVASWAKSGNRDRLPVSKAPRPVVQNLASAAAIAWNTNNGLDADLTLAHNTTITLSGGYNGAAALLRLVQDATGGRTLAFSGVQTGGRRVAVNANAGKRTLIALYRIGATWHYMGSILDG